MTIFFFNTLHCALRCHLESSIWYRFKNQAKFPSMLKLGPHRMEVANNSSQSSPDSNKCCLFKK